MTQRRNRKTEMAPFRRFAASIEKPFEDLQPRKGDSAAVREALHCASLLRRIRQCEEAGILRMLDPEMQRTIRTMERELTERQMRAMQ